MKKVVYIAFNKRSILTARELQRSLSENLGKEYEVRCINRKKFLKKPNYLIRWGNSYIDCPDGCIEINSKEALTLTSNKLLMARTLRDDKSVPFPRMWDLEGGYEVDWEEEVFIRNKYNQVRFRSNPIEGDQYALEDVKKVREFRVHVFNERTIGVYEKIPQEGADANIRKNDNCDFRRLDMSNPDIKEELKGVRPASRSAVRALGLLFGGVDVLLSENGQVFVNEVNSAPSLNGPNIERWSNFLASELTKDPLEEDPDNEDL